MKRFNCETQLSLSPKILFIIFENKRTAFSESYIKIHLWRDRQLIVIFKSGTTIKL